MNYTLSIMQPWSWLIVHGFKDIENRDWRPTNPGLKFRGAILIHAGKKMDKDFDYDWAEALIGRQMPRDFDLGGIVGACRVVDCVTAHDSPWFFGPYGFVLREARRLPFFPCAGQLGFYKSFLTPT